jgi:DNA invertase Pin-like site-specific DNA recombinase
VAASTEPACHAGCTAAGLANLERPALIAAERLASRGDALVVSKGDRLARSLSAYVRFMDAANQGGWTIIAVDGSIDLSTPHGRAMANMSTVFAELGARHRRRRHDGRGRGARADLGGLGPRGRPGPGPARHGERAAGPVDERAVVRAADAGATEPVQLGDAARGVTIAGHGAAKANAS